MIPKIIASSASAALLLTASLAVGQPAEPDPADPPVPAAPATGNTGDSSSSADPGADTRPPSTYRPSEEISEDLSVSFPVDI